MEAAMVLAVLESIGRHEYENKNDLESDEIWSENDVHQKWNQGCMQNA